MPVLLSELLAALLATLLTAGVLAGCAGPESEALDAVATVEVLGPATELVDFTPGPAAMRRLTRTQYKATIRGIFGQDIEVLPPTENDVPLEGLATIGAKTASVTPAGMEGYDLSARQIAATVLGPERREATVPCAPADEAAPDDTCAAAFVETVAPLVLRRSLRAGEGAAYVARARSATEELGDFWAGLEAIVVGWLLSPDFLFIQERVAEPLPSGHGVRVAAEALASRLSYFFWGSGPDLDLLQAAADGSLMTDEGYTAQVDRLLADTERLEQGMRALFTDFLELDALGTLDKDKNTYPAFTAAAIEDAREQTLRTVVDHLLVQRADYRDLFTTRKTFMTRNLGPIYGVPVVEDWEVHEFPEGGARAGILSHVSFLALNARAARSSPVLRGVFVLDKLLCIKIPPPPPDVSFDTVAPSEVNAPTARERLAAHRVSPSCNGCHNVMDNIGLALENFDGIGAFRTHENGHLIDAGGTLMGDDYGDVRGFHEAMRNAPNVPECIVEKLFMHSVGREFVPAEARLIDALTSDFADDGYDFVSLMRNIALSHGFRATSGPQQDGEGHGVEQEGSP